MEPMAPAYDRKRTSPAKITDYAFTARLHGQGFDVVRIEMVEGSGRVHITWTRSPHPDQTLAVEQLLMERYQKFSHGV